MTDKMGPGPNGQISDCMIEHKHISFFLSLLRMVVSQSAEFKRRLFLKA